MNWDLIKKAIDTYPRSNLDIIGHRHFVRRTIAAGILALLCGALSLPAYSSVQTDGAWVLERFDTSIYGHHETNHSVDLALNPEGQARIVYGQSYRNGSFHNTKVLLSSRQGVDDWLQSYVSSSGYGTMGSYQMIAEYTPQGKLCVAFNHNYDDTLSLRCGSPEARPWSTELVIDNPSLYAAAMTFGSDEDAHIIHTERGTRNLIYRHGSGTPEIVDASPYIFGWGASVAVDTNDVPHAAYFVDFGGTAKKRQLRYAMRTPYGWRVWVVDTDRMDAPGNVYISIDRDGQPVIAYYHDLSDELRLVRLVAGTWQRDVVASNLTNGVLARGAAVALRLDSLDRPNLVYVDQGDMVYTVLDDTGSHPSEIIFDGQGGPSAHLNRFEMKLDANDRPHVVFMIGSGIRYLYRTASQLVELTDGLPMNNLAAPTGYEHSFTFDVPAGVDRLRIASQGGTGNADLYVRYGEAPTTSVFDCSPLTPGNDETCSFDHPAAGTWYVTLRAESAYADVILSAIHDVATPLVHDELRTVKAASAGEERFYKIEVPVGQDLLMFDTTNRSTLSGGDVDLYVRLGTIATTDTFDCVSSKLGDNRENCTIASPQPGTWYVTLGTRDYIDRETHVIAHFYADPVQELYSGIAVYDLTGNWASQKFFKVWVPENASVLDVVMSGTTTAVGDIGADLYVRRDGLPTVSDFDCRPYLHGSSVYEEACTFPSPAGGYWYVMIRGYGFHHWSGISYSGISLRAMSY